MPDKDQGSGGQQLAEIHRVAPGGQQNRQAGQSDYPGRGRKAGQRCGAYQGACDIDSDNMRARVKTGKTQPEFAALCGISERTLRTWETTGNVSIRTGAVILARLRALGAVAQAGRRQVRYRDDYTGATWSGKGQMPVWLKAELSRGRRLEEFSAGAP